MEFNIDLRFLVPPILNFVLQMLFVPPNANLPWPLGSDHSTLKMALVMILGFFFILLFISSKVILTLVTTVEPLRLNFGDFRYSGLVLVALLASFALPPSFFWPVYLICIFISPWSHTLFNKFKHSLLEIPPLIITCIRQPPAQEPRSTGSSGTFLRLPVGSPNEIQQHLHGQQQVSDEDEYVGIMFGHA